MWPARRVMSPARRVMWPARRVIFALFLTRCTIHLCTASAKKLFFHGHINCNHFVYFALSGLLYSFLVHLSYIWKPVFSFLTHSDGSLNRKSQKRGTPPVFFNVDRTPRQSRTLVPVKNSLFFGVFRSLNSSFLHLSTIK